MRILKEESIGLVIDIQERLIPHIDGHEVLVENTIKLIKGLNILEIPLMITEQYSKGLGPTVPEVMNALPIFEPIEKISFSCCDEPNYMKELFTAGKKNIIICGIETHVCVLQTVIDLMDREFQPVIIADCVSSRKQVDKHIALERMKQEGAIISSYESILFELARVAGTESFKQISKLVK